MSLPVRELASDAAHQVAHNPKVQGAVSAGITALGTYNLIEATTSILSLVSMLVGICVGLYAISNARKTGKKLEIETYLLNMKKQEEESGK